ncbi:hypothetical protein HK097_008208 [Rhizophlyctis rosea]|uniref:UBC core domain-containing protein n=1 Tax=Rhizophlyctis rosea TaxID=64517 RepID=A0AAD5X5I8_9FUNG|nr:hypothetical protein HK097_008208 [Rhizophlyctis rosea]
MGRKEFRADVEELKSIYKTKLKDCSPLNGLSEGDEDGMVKFRFRFDSLSWISVSVCLDDLGGYPKSSIGWLFVDDSSEDPKATQGSEIISQIPVNGQPIKAIVRKCVEALCDFLHIPNAFAFLSILGEPIDLTGPPTPKQTRSPPSDRSYPGMKRSRRSGGSDSESDHNGEDDDEDEAAEYSAASDEDAMDEDDLDRLMYSHHTGALPAKRDVLLRDRAQMVEMGYLYVGYLTHAAEDGFILYNSIPVATLLEKNLLTADQCDAWNLSQSAFIVTLMKFEPEYVDVMSSKGNNYIKGLRMNAESESGIYDKQPSVNFRVLASDKAQVATKDAQAAFQAITANTQGSHALPGVKIEEATSLTQFMLSWTLSDLLNSRFLQILAYRLEYQLEWAGAEYVYRRRHSIAGEAADDSFMTGGQMDAHWNEAHAHDFGERGSRGFDNDLYSLLAGEHTQDDHLNFPLLVTRYVLRRLRLAAKFCLVCHRRTATDLEALRPFVCESPLCTYQYLQLGLGPSIELEILHNANVVDMLISFAYIAAVGYGQNVGLYNNREVAPGLEPFPYGVGYNDVKQFTSASGGIGWWAGSDVYGVNECQWGAADVPAEPKVGDYIEFDHLGHVVKRKVAKVLTHKHLQVELPISHQSPLPQTAQPIPFTIHRNEFVGWAVDPSNDANSRKADHELLIATLEKLPCVQVLAKTLHRLRRGSLTEKTAENQVAEESGLEQTAPVDSSVEAPADPFADPFEKCDPKMFLVQKTSLSLRPFLDMIDKLLYPLLRWIICSNRSYFRELVDPRERIAGVNMRYAQFKMVMGSPDKEARFLAERERECASAPVKSIWAFHETTPDHNNYGRVLPGGSTQLDPAVNYVQMVADQSLNVTGDNGQTIGIPAAMIAAAHNASGRHADKVEEMEQSMEVWDFDDGFWALNTKHAAGEDDDMDEWGEDLFDDAHTAPNRKDKERVDRDMKADATMEALDLMPPPEYATPTATKALHKELRNLLKAQQSSQEKDRGWVLDVADVTNLYQWTVRLTHFEDSLPLQMDLKAKGPEAIKAGITLEVRFGPEFPMTPPYVRVIKPRFLQFMHGGGGHVTAGGSICMDLLTMGGWSPAYAMESVLLQIRMALTSLDPKPARLDTVRGWDVAYGTEEAISAFVRVAQQHGWAVPVGWEKLFGSYSG